MSQNTYTNDTSRILQDEIYPRLDVFEVFSETMPTQRGNNIYCECPGCGKRRAYISFSKKTGSPQIICNRVESCTYYKGVWEYISDKNSLSKQDTLKELARLANYNLDSKESLPNSTKKPLDVVLRNHAQHNEEIQYVEFKKTKSYEKILISKYIPKYGKMSLAQKVKVVCTYVYQFSLQTNQESKAKEF